MAMRTYVYVSLVSLCAGGVLTGLALRALPEHHERVSARAGVRDQEQAGSPIFERIRQLQRGESSSTPETATSRGDSSPSAVTAAVRVADPEVPAGAVAAGPVGAVGRAPGARAVESAGENEGATPEAREVVTVESFRKRFAAVAASPFGIPRAGQAAAKLLGAMKELGPEGLNVVLDELDSEDPRRRLAAAQLVGGANEADGISALIDTALNDPDEQVAAGASQALAIMDIPESRREEVVQAVSTLADAPNGLASEINGIFSLVRLGDPEGIERALAYLENPSQSPQLKALLATNLATLGLPALLPVMDLAVRLFAQSPLPVVATSIGYYQVVGATDRLLAIAQNAALSPELREQAALAMQTLASAAPPP